TVRSFRRIDGTVQPNGGSIAVCDGEFNADFVGAGCFRHCLAVIDIDLACVETIWHRSSKISSFSGYEIAEKCIMVLPNRIACYAAVGSAAWHDAIYDFYQCVRLASNAA